MLGRRQLTHAAQSHATHPATAKPAGARTSKPTTTSPMLTAPALTPAAGETRVRVDLRRASGWRHVHEVMIHDMKKR